MNPEVGDVVTIQWLDIVHTGQILSINQYGLTIGGTKESPRQLQVMKQDVVFVLPKTNPFMQTQPESNPFMTNNPFMV